MWNIKYKCRVIVSELSSYCSLMFMIDRGYDWETISDDKALVGPHFFIFGFFIYIFFNFLFGVWYV